MKSPNRQWSEWRRADVFCGIERLGPPPSLTFHVKRNPMNPKIEQPTDNEKLWIQEQLRGAAKLVDIFWPQEAGKPLTLAALDCAYSVWYAGNEKDTKIINAVINRVGVAFGQSLVEGLGLSWVIATDERGADLAVHGPPGKADVLVYPANFVAKRWERQEMQFLEKSYNQIAEQVRALP